MSEIRTGALAALEPLVAGVIQQHAVETDRDGRFPAHTVSALQESGLAGLLIPTAQGGMGGTFGDAAHVVERIARVCGSSAMVVCMHYAGSAVLAAHGDEEVQRAIAAGAHLSTLAFSEAGSRSHFWAPVSSAAGVEGGIQLDARKSWVTSAHHASAYVWSSQPVAAEGASTLWLVPRESAGIEVGGKFDGLGLRGNDSTRVGANAVVVPESARLGADGQGFELMMGVVLPVFSLMVAGCAVGMMEGALASATEHVSGSRYAHVELALRDLPTIRNQLAKARCEADMARALWADACAAVDGGREDASLRVLQVKAATGDAVLSVVQTCMRICGGAAFRREVGVERRFRDAQAGAVMAPTGDVLYDFIGKALTGLPLF